MDRLKAVLSYDPITGYWTHLRTGGKAVKGARAGYIKKAGYYVISIHGVQVKSSRAAWFYMSGEWPLLDIDHADLNKTNDAWSNLRQATNSQNGHNRGMQRNNKSGYKGVYKFKRRWRANIKVDGVRLWLGDFDTIEEAASAYAAAAKEHHGEFARIS